MATMILLPKLYLSLVTSLTTQLTQGALDMKQLCGFVGETTAIRQREVKCMKRIHTRLVQWLVIEALILPLWRCGSHCERNTRANSLFRHRPSCVNRLAVNVPSSTLVPLSTRPVSDILQSRVGEHAPRSVNHRLDLCRCAVLCRKYIYIIYHAQTTSSSVGILGLGFYI